MKELEKIKKRHRVHASTFMEFCAKWEAWTYLLENDMTTYEICNIMFSINTVMEDNRMKLRITRKELEDLTFDQKQNLCDLWIPNVYDVAVATVCIDAAEEKFDQITYVIGGIKLLKHHDMLLTDLKFMPDNQLKIQEEESSSDNIASDRIDGIEDLSNSEKVEEKEDEALQDFSFDEDFNFEFQRPESYSKQDCVPLLDIGQMIDILERRNFGQGDFYLYANIEDNAIEMGKSNFSIENDLDDNNKNNELCDILWESVKALL